MTSKKLGALLRSVPPATAAPDENGQQPVTQQVTKAPPVSPAAVSSELAQGGSIEPEVSLQVLIPANIRRQLAIKSAERGESLRSLVLQAIRELGIEVTEADIKGKRGRRNS